jgi:hypothetical protein
VKVDAKADAKVKVVEAEKPEKKVEVVKADAKAEVRFLTVYNGCNAVRVVGCYL